MEAFIKVVYYRFLCYPKNKENMDKQKFFDWLNKIGYFDEPKAMYRDFIKKYKVK